MFETGTDRTLHIGRFENLRDEALRLLEETGTPITGRMRDFIEKSQPLNASPRPAAYDGGYNAELAGLVAEKERYIVDRFGYTF